MRRNVTPQLKKKIVFYYITLFVLAFSFGFMPFADSLKDTSRIYLLINGILFWTGFLLTLCSFILLIIHARSGVEKNDVSYVLKTFPLPLAIGESNFLYTDIIMVLAIINMLLSVWVKRNNYVFFASLGVFIILAGIRIMIVITSFTGKKASRRRK